MNTQERRKRKLRFRDLKAEGIVENYTTLNRLIREQGFPPGYRIGAQTLGWDETEIDAWLDSRRRPSPASESDAA